jgi:predicted nucleic-acid-binding protein
MIGLDTNIVLRILTGDDPVQVNVVKKLLVAHQQTAGVFFLNQVVLAECAWALKGAYKMSRQEIAQGMEGLLDTPAFAVEEPKVVASALKCFRESAADFSDCLIAAKNAATGCVHTATFDKKMRDLPAVKVL